METLERLDKKILFWINDHHSGFLDHFMYWMSDKEIWIPVYLMLLYLLYRNYQLKSFFIILVAVAVVITLTDQLSVKAFKFVFERYRPCHNEDFGHLLRTPFTDCGGKYGFVSSHAANAFGLTVFIGLLLKKKNWFPLIALGVWAVLIGYSRIYLGKHYPSDVVGGAMLGILISVIIYCLLQLIFRKYRLK